MSTMPTVNLNDLAHRITLTVRVTGKARFRARWWLARRLLVLAAIVAGCGLAVETGDDRG